MSEVQNGDNQVQLSTEAQEELRNLSRRHDLEYLGVGFLITIVLFFLFGGRL